MIREVFVVIYEHRHGMDVSAHASHGQAYAAVAEIARTWWQERADRACNGLIQPDTSKGRL